MGISAVIVKDNNGPLLGLKNVVLHLYLQNDLTDGELSVCGAQFGSFRLKLLIFICYTNNLGLPGYIYIRVCLDYKMFDLRLSKGVFFFGHIL